EPAQALARQIGRVDAIVASVYGQVSVQPLCDHLVGEDLDRLADAVTQLLADADGVFVRLVDERLERAGAFVGGELTGDERVRAEQRGDGLELASLLGV